jgi:predicted Zn-dependent protease with MMP-like domain/Flp pilus assembly protein TadD
MRRDPVPKSLEEALELAAKAFDDGDLEAARTAAARAVTLKPDSAEARHYLAAALCELGDHDGADRQYHEALALAPDDPEILIGACHLLLDHAKEPDGFEEVLELARRGGKIVARAKDTELEAEFLVAEGQALVGLGEPAEALACFEGAAKIHPEHPEPHLQVGITRFEKLEIDAAREALLRALALEPELALAHWYLGLCAERKAETEEAERRFRRARRIDPAGFPEAVRLSEAEFDRVVEEAIARIPERVRAEMQNLAITCEPIPSDDDLLGEDPPLPPTILGVFRGHPLGDKQSPDPWAHFPSSVVLYQRNLERACHSREELIEQIEITVLHEVGHFLGWDEDDLAERGLD